MFKNKKGMEIAISTVVGLILGALMLFAGIVLMTNIMGKTNTTYTQIDEQMREEILQAFDTNQPIYVHKNTLSPKKSEDVRFGVGILNIFDEPKNFTIKLEYDRNKFDTDEYKVAYMPTEISELKSRQKETIIIIVPTKNLEKGQHTIILNITYQNNTEWIQYDTPKILYVNK